MQPSRPDISFIDVLKFIVRNRWPVVGLGAVGLGLGILASFLMTPVYRSEATLLLRESDESGTASALIGQLGGIAALAGVNATGRGLSRQEALALLNSRVMAESFITEHDLLPVLYADRWDGNALAWKTGERQPTLGQAYTRFDEDVRKVSVDRTTGVVILAIEWDDPLLAAEWAGSYVEMADDALRRRAIAESEKGLRFLEAELGRTDVLEVRQAIFGLMETMAKNRMLATTRDEYAFRVIDPPVVSDVDQPVRPDRLLLVAIGSVIGLLLGFALAVTRECGVLRTFHQQDGAAPARPGGGTR